MKKKYRVFYSFYFSDCAEVEASSEREAEEIVKGMIEREEIGNVLEMPLGEEKVWVE